MSNIDHEIVLLKVLRVRLDLQDLVANVELGPDGCAQVEMKRLAGEQKNASGNPVVK